MPTQIELIKKYQLLIRGHLGQHFLIDPNVQKKIVDALHLTADAHVLEIGPGLGALTGEILKRGSKVWAIEKDARFVAALKEEYSEKLNNQLTLVHSDVLKFDFEILRKIRKTSKKAFRVVSNLPYYITAPIIFLLLENRDLFDEAILMMQKEVAERILAQPGTKDYGRLTLGIRCASEVGHLFSVSPNCFTPKPQVESSVLKLTFIPPSKGVKKAEEDFLFYVIKLAFSQRRKTLLSLLVHDKKINQTREEILEKFKRFNYLPTVRGEELLLKDFIVLSKELFPKS